jgi:hypothetical protein
VDVVVSLQRMLSPEEWVPSVEALCTRFRRSNLIDDSIELTDQSIEKEHGNRRIVFWGLDSDAPATDDLARW